MKKFLSLTLALAMLGTALTGCSSKDAASLTSAESTQQTAPVRQEQSQAEKALALINTFATGDTDTARSLLSDGYIQHNLAYGTGAGEQVAFDIFRFDENGKIAEHWDVMETIADQSTWQNQNGKFCSLPGGNHTTILCVLHKPYKSHYNQNIKRKQQIFGGIYHE